MQKFFGNAALEYCGTRQPDMNRSALFSGVFLFSFSIGALLPPGALAQAGAKVADLALGSRLNSSRRWAGASMITSSAVPSPGNEVIRHPAVEQRSGYCGKVHPRHRHPGAVHDWPGELLQRSGPEELREHHRTRGEPASSVSTAIAPA
jgi:hypothetical protein